jgi:predicted DNA-binding transcriptional regulator AlpA
MARQGALPPTLPPGLINREAAAAFFGVSPNTFDEMVRDGRAPPPRLIGRRKLWIVHELSAAADALPVDRGAAADRSWEDIDAP